MTGIVTLWGYALVGLLFGALAMRRLRHGEAALPRRLHVAALALTALWALAVAGIDATDLTARIAESIRDLLWLGLMLALVRRDGRAGVGRGAAYAAVMLVAALTVPVALAADVVSPAASAVLATTLRALRMMVAAGALVLTHDLVAAPAVRRLGARRVALVGLAAIWALDLLCYAAAYAIAGSIPMLVATRGGAMVVIGLLLGAAAQRDGEQAMTLSRTVALRFLFTALLALYVGATALVVALVPAVIGPARIVQTAIVLGASVTLVTLVSTPWLRAWARVMVAKHLFRHRYDYRVEWQRFAETLGQPGATAAPLATRVVKAVADLTASPAGLLFTADGAGLGATAGWAWDMTSLAGQDTGQPLARHLAITQRIVELDAVRAQTAAAGERAAVPQWLINCEEAWVVVPLLHLDSLIGAILLARPPVDRALDWEDFDLLRVVGRQAASYLAEDRSHTALADAARFEEFNRRFAFILHDIKNLVSQLTLVARNAERHADNPDFRTDMVATLQDSSMRMTALLARLSQHDAQPAEPLVAVDVAALAKGIAAARRAGHPVAVRAEGPLWATAHPGRLEQVIAHLLQNAAEASAASEPVLLTVGEAGGKVILTVEDKGTGMTSGFLREQLFRPFVSTKPGGFGLGAFEARQLVEAMNGTLAVASRPGEGSCFTITLPFARGLELAA